MSGEDLSLQLQSDEEEEDGREAIVDPEQQGFGNLERPDANLERGPRLQCLGGYPSTR